MRAERDEERTAVEFVLSHYFQKTIDGWCSKRAELELRINRKRIKSARTNGKKGGRPITQRVMSGLAKDNPSLTQQEPEAKLPKPKPKPEPKPNINTVAGASRLNGAQHEIQSDGRVMALPLREGGDFDARQSLVR
jgi:uncharacterized protein YdaU (DUF1376 family)